MSPNTPGTGSDSSQGDSSRLTSLSLLARVQQQENDAWKRFVHLYGPLVERWIRATGVRASDVPDLCQEVFRCLTRSIGTFKRPVGGTGSFRAWLRTVTRNSVLDHYRRQQHQPQAIGGSAAFERMQSVADLPEDNDDVVANDRVEIVRRALELIRPEFAEHTWTAFCRVALDGHTPAEVAEALAMSAFAVRQANYRIRRRLREELSEMLD